MKKNLYLLIILILNFYTGFSQDQQNSLLWKISGNGLDKPSFIFGTIHIICPEDLQISPILESSLSSTNQLVMELDMDEPDFMMKMQQASFNEGMTNISENIDQMDLALLDDFLRKQYNTEMSQMGVFKPMVLMSMVMLKSISCQTPKSLETELIKIATINDQQINGLETVEEQFALFDSIPEKEQMVWIIDMIKDSVNTKGDFHKMTEAYLEQDIDAIYEFSNSVYPEFAKYEDAFLFDRNKNWIPKIKKIIHNESTFIAVGAGHLGTDKGVIRLLQEEGYNVVPVKME